MKLIKQSVELIPQNELFEHIERCARVCYKSEDKQSEHSGEFVNKLTANFHLAMLEHGTVYLMIRRFLNPNDTSELSKYKHNPYSYCNELVFGDNSKGFYVTTNWRVIKENGWEDDLKYLCEPTEFHKKRYTLKLITSIGIVRELLRHRKFSFANESTRYCNYSKDKFDNELTFIKPYWLNIPVGIVYWHDGICWRVQQDENNPMEWFSIKPQEDFSDKDANIASMYFNTLNRTEETYLSLLKYGCTHQQAREVLPLCTKSELVMTGFESDWKEFLDKRLYETTGKVHPDMKELAQMIEIKLFNNEK